MENILDKKINIMEDKPNFNKKAKMIRFIKKYKWIIASTTLFWMFSFINVVLICNFVKILASV